MIKMAKNFLNRYPEKTGTIFFKKDDEILCAISSYNIRKSIQYYVENDDQNIIEMRDKANSVQYQETADIFDAFIIVKDLDDKPEYSDIIKPYNEFVYLGIDLFKAPFITIADDTQKDSIYLGPFVSRFETMNFLYTMGELFSTPVCETKDYPCIRLRDKVCKGWCVDKQDIDTILESVFLTSDNHILADLENKRKDFFNSLDFSKEDLLKQQIKIIQKYYEQLKFLVVTKELSITFTRGDDEFCIEAGLLKSIKKGNKIKDFPIIECEYRDNEALAVNKNEYSERRIIFNTLIREKPDFIDELYKKLTQKNRT